MAGDAGTTVGNGDMYLLPNHFRCYGVLLERILLAEFDAVLNQVDEILPAKLSE